VANASGIDGTSRRHWPSTTASSIAIEAPWPDEGDVACAASPTSTMRSLNQRGTVGKS
jgi:hypothetical protein